MPFAYVAEFLRAGIATVAVDGRRFPVSDVLESAISCALLTTVAASVLGLIRLIQHTADQRPKKKILLTPDDQAPLNDRPIALTSRGAPIGRRWSPFAKLRDSIVPLANRHDRVAGLIGTLSLRRTL
jgi:hypothetical protein